MVEMKDYFNFALRTFRHKPTRSWLTIIGILIGISAVVALMSLAQGMQDTVNQMFEMLNPNSIYVIPGSGMYGTLAAVAGTEQLTDADISAIEKVNGVEKAVGFATVLAGVERGDEIKYSFVLGYDPSEMTLNDFSSIGPEIGRELKEGDKYKAVIGWNYANGNIFSRSVKVNDELTIGGKTFTVVGIAERVGSEEDDKQVYIPLETMEEMYGDMGYATIFVLTKANYPMDIIAENIKRELRDERDLEEGQEDFTVQTAEQLLETYGIVLTLIQVIVIGIAGISLLVGGIGIMNTMYTTVLERTREIGIMKAIGAKNSDIIMIFLIESGILGLVGGAIGVIIGVGISKAVETVTLQSGYPFGASYPIWLIGGALLFSFAVGSLSGLLPAIQAAKKKPADSLRY